MGNLYRFTSNPIGYPAPFAAEQDMETFLFEHMSLLGEHLGTGDAEATVQKTWRQMHLPRTGAAGRLDVVFLAMDQEQPVLYLAELKNEPIGKGAVNQVTGYLDGWRQDTNGGNRKQVADWLEQMEQPFSKDQAAAVALNVQGLLVGPSYTAEGIEAVVEWAKKSPEMPVQALKLLRFRTGDGEGHVVLVDDVFIKPRKGQRVVLRWVDLAARKLVTEETIFEMTCAGGTFGATPDFGAGRGKNLRLLPEHRQAALKALQRAEEMETKLAQEGGWDSGWVIDKLREAHRRIKDGESVPASNLALFIQRAFGAAGEPDWQRPAHLWRMKAGDKRFVWELDAKLR